MYPVSDKYLQSVVADSRDMPYRVTLSGVGVLDESKVSNMTLDENVGGNHGIELGTSNSATLRFTIRDADPIDYNDMMVLPESGLVLSDGSVEWIPLGVFWVTDSSTSNDYKTLNLTCSDGMYNMSGEYVSALTYPSTIKAVVAEIVAQAGVEFEGIDYLPDIPVRRKLEGATHREAIGYAAGCCGKNARFNRRGKLEFSWYNQTGHTIERREQYLDGMTKLNNCPLSVDFDITGQQEKYSVEFVTDGHGSITATPGKNILEGKTVVLSVTPSDGYELASLVAFGEDGDEVYLYKRAEGGWDFEQPDSNVIVTAAFRRNKNGPFTLTVKANEGGTITHSPSSHEWGHIYFDEGDVVTVTIVPDTEAGKQLDKIVTTPGDLIYSKNGNNYEFDMPDSDVTITAYFKDAEVVVTPYSWLQKPVDPPSAKPYWAVFYKDDPNLPTCQKYYLVWFDSWSATLYDTAYDMNEYKIQLNGYYYCGGKNNGNGNHGWDSSTWTGNGDSASSVKWNSYVGFMWSGTDSEQIDKQYCLIASNTDLYYNGFAIFSSNESDITDIQTPFIQDGVDVRESGSLSYWMCPDTFSAPLPNQNWMVLMPESGLYMTVGTDGKYVSALSSYPDSMIVLFYNKITIQNIGTVNGSSDEEFYIATVTNGRWAYMRSENLGWDELHELPAGAVIGFRNPLISTEPKYLYSDGNAYQFSGILATNSTLYVDGEVFMHNNACRVCDCASTAEVAMFANRSTTNDLIHEDSIEIEDVQATADGDAVVLFGVTARSSGDSLELIPTFPTKRITVSYTNPMIYEKMVPYIADVVQSIKYTPAKVKHRGNPAFQAGDVVRAPDRTGMLHAVLIMQQTMVFGGGMNSEITCPGQTDKTKNFSAKSLSSKPVTQEAIDKSAENLEREIYENNSLVYSALYKSISVTENQVKSVVEKQSNDGKTIAKLEQTVDEDRSAIELLVEYDEDGEPTASASLIIEAINGESSAKIKADRLDIEGKELNIKVASTNITGKLTANQIDVLGGLTCTATQMSGTSATGNVTIISPGVVNVKNKDGLGFFASGSEVEIIAADGYFMKVYYKGSRYGLSISNGSIQATNITNE